MFVFFNHTPIVLQHIHSDSYFYNNNFSHLQFSSIHVAANLQRIAVNKSVNALRFDSGCLSRILLLLMFITMSNCTFYEPVPALAQSFHDASLHVKHVFFPQFFSYLLFLLYFSLVTYIHALDHPPASVLFLQCLIL